MIQVQSLSKYYGGKRALGPVAFEIEEGETVGFLGLNGAGKTTVLRILATDLRPSAGSVSVAGIDALERPHEVRKRIGFLPETPPLYPEMTVRDYLAFAAELRDVGKGQRSERVGSAIEAENGEVSVVSDASGYFELHHQFHAPVPSGWLPVHARVTQAPYAAASRSRRACRAT